MTDAPRTIEISPVTRVEGHGKVTIHLDKDGQVDEARLHIVEFRGFERFIHGRLLWEVPVIVQRLCGICPVSHHLAAAKAMDVICGVDELPPTAEKMRRLMHYGQVMQSHVLHFFHLAAPDLLFGFDAPAAQRNIFEVLRQKPELGRRAIMMRKFGQDVIEATAGKKIHGTGAIPGGINRNLPIATRDEFLKTVGEMREWAQDALALARDYTLSHAELVGGFGNFPSKYMSLVRESDGALDLYHGNLRMIDPVGDVIFDQLPYDQYHEVLREEVRAWSYMKFPFLKDFGPDEGWYRVGPLARMNTVSLIDTPLANAARDDLMTAADGPKMHPILANHWARMIEVLHCVEKIEELLHDPDLQGTDLKATGDRREEGIGVIEAPRGNLIHHYKVDENDQVTYCNLIVSTTHNNEGMNRAVKDVAVKQLSGQPEITEGMLNQVEVAIRAYDPCLSCATHALGQMPLEVELLDADGRTLEKEGARDMIQLIGYGNPGRGDDGLGPALAARMDGAHGVLVKSDYQLTVDHALLIAETPTVIFADALMHADAPYTFGPVTASTSHDVTSHSLSPQAVLALCKTLYGHGPEAFVLGITGYEFGEVKEGLSPQAVRNLDLAEAFLRDWLAQHVPKVGGLAHA